MLTTSLYWQFASGVRERGAAYFRQRRVREVSRTATFFSAEVRGSSLYDVDLSLDGHDLTVSCTCPYSDGYATCKHIWAALLAAEQRGFGAHLTGKVRLLSENLEDDDPEEEYESRTPAVKAKRKRKAARPAWEEHLAAVERAALPPPTPSSHWRRDPGPQRFVFLVDAAETEKSRKLALEFGVQPLKKNGEWGAIKRQAGGIDIHRLTDPVDRRIFTILNGADRVIKNYYSSYTPYQQHGQFRLGEAHVEVLLPLLAESGRLFGRADDGVPPHPLTVDDGPPWEFSLDIARDESGTTLRVTGRLVRAEESLPLESLDFLVSGLMLHDRTLHRFRDTGGLAWVTVLRKQNVIEVPYARGQQLASRMLAMPRPERTSLPEELKYEEIRVTPRPRVVVKKADYYGREVLDVQLSFIYDDATVPAKPAEPSILQTDRRRVITRDGAAEALAAIRLRQMGVMECRYAGKLGLELAANRLVKFTLEATAAGWLVEADGKLYRKAGHFELNVTSGTDWFDLGGAASFDGVAVPLPRLLEALRSGEKTVVLDDGTIGIVPEEWLKQYGLIARMGAAKGDAIRFGKAQIGVLDALLASRPDIEFDKQFEKARKELKKFDGVKPADPPPAFKGELRGYQRDGLGWLRFLRTHGFGGCLADDMGLGKTVQVLAHLASKRKGTTLIVVPKSLIFNWKQEAARFAPKLKVLDHTGLDRGKDAAAFATHDIVLTTYGTLRRDAALIADHHFDTCVLDESQAAKNSTTDTAKAVKLIQADHRLALSGTPIENHLGELWTLFDFLNPGMLGRAGAFGGEAGSLRNPGPEMRELLAHALKPFILRRTKSQVAKDLPGKTEQTLYCELEPEQRKLYDELRDHYRASLLSKVDELGMKRTKIQVLAALLRLRQAACHPGLIDEKRTEAPSAKLDVLLPQIQEVVEEGHKVLVFSQFTSFLAIAKHRFDDLGLDYEYLDGKTRDRAARVDRFQTDPDCRLFLVSLKAGGVGLNLTAADYVYLLDPWWNPAAEAQAIDRSHRIGQTQPVFAYRMIAKNTVEEKVLELQQKKKSLADSILGGDERLITELKREDLELLLS
jgi:superfamily II DNA or RNA helicase